MDTYLQELFKKLISDDATERFTAQQELSTLDVDSKRQMIPRLIQALENEEMRSLTANALGAIGRMAAPDLIRLCQDETKDQIARHLAKLILDKLDGSAHL